MSQTLSGMKTAVVLSGGGATGAYEVGVLKALISGQCPATSRQPLEPDAFFGTSIGSFSAAFLAAHWDYQGRAAATNLENTWLTRLVTDGGHASNYRIRLNPLDFLNPSRWVPNPFQPMAMLARDSAFVGWDLLNRAVTAFTAKGELVEERLAQMLDFASFVDSSPWLATIKELIDFEKVRTSSRCLGVAVTNWSSGEVRMFTNRDMTPMLGPKTLQSSTAIPGVFPPVEIGTEPYVDGGVLMNTPLSAALSNGADVIHMVYLDPDVRSIPLSAIRNTLGTIYRMMIIGWAAAVNDDIEDARSINESLRLLEHLTATGDLHVGESEKVLKSLSSVRAKVKRYRPVTIHRYHPSDDISGGALGLLNFKRSRLEELIERGFTDAQLHDCKLEGCVLAAPTEKAKAAPAAGDSHG